MMRMVSKEELYNLPTAEFAFRRGFINRKLTVFNVVFHACADLKNVQATKALFNMLKENNEVPDLFIIIQRMRCYLNSGDLDRGVQIFEEFMESKRPPAIELYIVRNKSYFICRKLSSQITLLLLKVLPVYDDDDDDDDDRPIIYTSLKFEEFSKLITQAWTSKIC